MDIASGPKSDSWEALRNLKSTLHPAKSTTILDWKTASQLKTQRAFGAPTLYRNELRKILICMYKPFLIHKEWHQRTEPRTMKNNGDHSHRAVKNNRLRNTPGKQSCSLVEGDVLTLGFGDQATCTWQGFRIAVDCYVSPNDPLSNGSLYCSSHGLIITV